MRKSFYTTHSGALFVSPGGQSENGQAVAQAGYSWGAINVADGNLPPAWQTTISQFNAAGLRVPVWGRIRNTSLENIMGYAIILHRPCILNIEDEFKVPGAPADIEARIKARRAANPTWTRELVINTVGWLYNDVDYSPIAHRPVQLQILVQDMKRDPSELPQITKDCIAHARAKGFRDIGVCFQTYGAAEPEWYDFWTGPRTLIWGDVVGAKSAWPEWKVT